MHDTLDWLKAECLPASLGAGKRAWLFDQGSLTRRLQALAQGQLEVRILAEGWQHLRDDECTALAAAPASMGWVREIYLCGRSEPWIFARSVARRDALQAAGLDLQNQGARPLGELLFSAQGFTRGELQTCRYPADWLPQAVRETGHWARRSCFTRGELGVLVAEVFLPAFWQAAGIDPHRR
ncbi:chorismate--pyruvate lyase family protein [Azomonas macrocytogenes]|uniref:Probable chorismate pyruvate-lyase n=1 Tax=Azomonas macrocytogenes TaxID=69962 RepID=A0A839T242_AZOMA|nr:chorismate lyase [Azomonas macrocytogenes]MBB3103482.1 chorismate--pyruvate lyase [Azomonas macrocytogenes]